MVVPPQGHLPGPRVVQVRERDAVLGANGGPDDDFVDVVELVPVLVVLLLAAAGWLATGVTFWVFKLKLSNYHFKS